MAGDDGAVAADAGGGAHFAVSLGSDEPMVVPAKLLMSRHGLAAASRSSATTPRTKAAGFAHGLINLARSRWRRVKIAMRGIKAAQAAAAEDREDFQAENNDTLAQVQTGALHVALEVENKHDLSKVNYLQQGNAEFYTPEMLAKRHALRSSPQVLAAIQAWWRWLPKKRGPPVPPSSDVLPGVLVQSAYFAMVYIIQEELLPRYGSEPDPDYDPQEDWEHDCKGDESGISYPNLFDALFELADMWSSSVDATEYGNLLSSLLFDCQEAERTRGAFAALLARFGFDGADPDDLLQHNDGGGDGDGERGGAADGEAADGGEGDDGADGRGADGNSGDDATGDGGEGGAVASPSGGAGGSGGVGEVEDDATGRGGRGEVEGSAGGSGRGSRIGRGGAGDDLDGEGGRRRGAGDDDGGDGNGVGTSGREGGQSSGDGDGGGGDDGAGGAGGDDGSKGNGRNGRGTRGDHDGSNRDGGAQQRGRQGGRVSGDHDGSNRDGGAQQRGRQGGRVSGAGVAGPPAGVGGKAGGRARGSLSGAGGGEPAFPYKAPGGVVRGAVAMPATQADAGLVHITSDQLGHGGPSGGRHQYGAAGFRGAGGVGEGLLGVVPEREGPAVRMYEEYMDQVIMRHNDKVQGHNASPSSMQHGAPAFFPDGSNDARAHHHHQQQQQPGGQHPHGGRGAGGLAAAVAADPSLLVPSVLQAMPGGLAAEPSAKILVQHWIHEGGGVAGTSLPAVPGGPTHTRSLAQPAQSLVLLGKQIDNPGAPAVPALPAPRLPPHLAYQQHMAKQPGAAGGGGAYAYGPPVGEGGSPGRSGNSVSVQNMSLFGPGRGGGGGLMPNGRGGAVGGGRVSVRVNGQEAPLQPSQQQQYAQTAAVAAGLQAALAERHLPGGGSAGMPQHMYGKAQQTVSLAAISLYEPAPLPLPADEPHNPNAPPRRLGPGFLSPQQQRTAAAAAQAAHARPTGSGAAAFDPQAYKFLPPVLPQYTGGNNPYSNNPYYDPGHGEDLYAALVAGSGTSQQPQHKHRPHAASGNGGVAALPSAGNSPPHAWDAPQYAQPLRSLPSSIAPKARQPQFIADLMTQQQGQQQGRRRSPSKGGANGPGGDGGGAGVGFPLPELSTSPPKAAVQHAVQQQQQHDGSNHAFGGARGAAAAVAAAGRSPDRGKGPKQHWASSSAPSSLSTLAANPKPGGGGGGRQQHASSPQRLPPLGIDPRSSPSQVAYQQQLATQLFGGPQRLLPALQGGHAGAGAGAGVGGAGSAGTAGMTSPNGRSPDRMRGRASAPVVAAGGVGGAAASAAAAGSSPLTLAAAARQAGAAFGEYVTVARQQLQPLPEA